MLFNLINITYVIAVFFICRDTNNISLTIFRLNESELFLTNPKPKFAGCFRLRIFQTLDDSLPFFIRDSEAVADFISLRIHVFHKFGFKFFVRVHHFLRIFLQRSNKTAKIALNRRWRSLVDYQKFTREYPFYALLSTIAQLIMNYLSDIFAKYYENKSNSCRVTACLFALKHNKDPGRLRLTVTHTCLACE